jgi:hypothetical protein
MLDFHLWKEELWASLIIKWKKSYDVLAIHCFNCSNDKEQLAMTNLEREVA